MYVLLMWVIALYQLAVCPINWNLTKNFSHRRSETQLQEATMKAQANFTHYSFFYKTMKSTNNGSISNQRFASFWSCGSVLDWHKKITQIWWGILLSFMIRQDTFAA